MWASARWPLFRACPCRGFCNNLNGSPQIVTTKTQGHFSLLNPTTCPLRRCSLRRSGPHPSTRPPAQTPTTSQHRPLPHHILSKCNHVSLSKFAVFSIFRFQIPNFQCVLNKNFLKKQNQTPGFLASDGLQVRIEFFEFFAFSNSEFAILVIGIRLVSSFVISLASLSPISSRLEILGTVHFVHFGVQSLNILFGVFILVTTGFSRRNHSERSN